MPRLAGYPLAVVGAECDALRVHGATIADPGPPAAYTENVEISAPTVELLTWVTARERSYADVLEAWRSNCPRTAVWTTP